MNRKFTALGGIAMVLIVLNHTIELSTNIPLRYGFPATEGRARAVLDLIKALGMFAVPIFLFISGTFVSYVARDESRKLTPKFLAGVLSRVWWPYLIWSLLFYVVIFFQFDERYSLAGYLKNLIVGYPFHFVPILLFFYILSPLLVRLAGRHALALVAGVAAYQVLLLVALQDDQLGARRGIFWPPVIGRTLAQWGVYFPLGLVYGMHIESIVPHLRKARWLAILLAAGGLLLRGLRANGSAPLSIIVELAPIGLVLLLLIVDRKSIPLARMMESIGKRSYGLYLSHLIVLDGILWWVVLAEPDLLKYRLLFLPVLFVLGLAVPLLIMNAASRTPGRAVVRYIFG